MNINEINDDKLLEKFLNRETMEKAPEGFVSNTLARIRIETAPERKSFLKRNKVPVISAIVISVLTVAAVLAPSQNTGSVFNKLSEYANLPLSLFRGLIPEIAVRPISIPEWLPYALTLLLLFGFVDRVLFRIFNRE